MKSLVALNSTALLVFLVLCCSMYVGEHTVPKKEALLVVDLVRHGHCSPYVGLSESNTDVFGTQWKGLGDLTEEGKKQSTSYGKWLKDLIENDYNEHIPQTAEEILSISMTSAATMDSLKLRLKEMFTWSGYHDLFYKGNYYLTPEFFSLNKFGQVIVTLADQGVTEAYWGWHLTTRFCRQLSQATKNRKKYTDGYNKFVAKGLGEELNELENLLPEQPFYYIDGETGRNYKIYNKENLFKDKFGLVNTMSLWASIYSNDAKFMKNFKNKETPFILREKFIRNVEFFKDLEKDMFMPFIFMFTHISRNKISSQSKLGKPLTNVFYMTNSLYDNHLSGFMKLWSKHFNTAPQFSDYDYTRFGSSITFIMYRENNQILVDFYWDKALAFTMPIKDVYSHIFRVFPEIRSSPRMPGKSKRFLIC